MVVEDDIAILFTAKWAATSVLNTAVPATALYLTKAPQAPGVTYGVLLVSKGETEWTSGTYIDRWRLGLALHGEANDAAGVNFAETARQVALTFQFPSGMTFDVLRKATFASMRPLGTMTELNEYMRAAKDLVKRSFAWELIVTGKKGE